MATSRRPARKASNQPLSSTPTRHTSEPPTSSNSTRNPWSKSCADSLLDSIVANENVSLPAVDDEEIERAYQRTSVARSIAQLRELSAASTRVARAKLARRSEALHAGTGDVTLSAALREKVATVEVLVERLDEAVAHRQRLSEVLGRRHRGEHLQIELEHHEAVVQLFANAASCMGDLQTHVQAMKWHHDNPSLTDGIKSTLAVLSRRARKIRETADALDMTATSTEE